ncbi:MAG: SRPBCC domain-containing protein [Bdellovibrionales bacterium]|nr:SRPBCC domain-containing protein [Bdellovibrionales bacterium]
MDSNKLNEIYITRLYKANVKQVWNAWVNPQQVSQWWGPRGFTLTTKRKEVRPGGDWVYTMHSPDGIDFPNHTKFLEVELYKKLVYDHGGFEEKPPLFRVTVFFTEFKEKTKMEMTMTLPTPEAATEIRQFIKKAGGDSTWDRLAEFLEIESSGKEIFVINRSFCLDIETIYELWTQPKHIMNWTPPVGFIGKYLSADIRPGGESFYEMSGNGLTMYGKAKYLEMIKPSRLIYTQIFVDKNGNISRHPMAPTWPEVMKTTVTFHQEGQEQTRVTVEWEVYGEASPEERETFKNAKAGMTQGWTGSFDKLDVYSAKLYLNNF